MDVFDVPTLIHLLSSQKIAGLLESYFLLAYSSLVHSTLGNHREAGLVSNSKVSVSTEQQFYQLSDGAKSFQSSAVLSKVTFIFLRPIQLRCK